MDINTKEELEELLSELGYSQQMGRNYASAGSLVWKDGKFEVAVLTPILPKKKVLLRFFRTDGPMGGGTGNHTNIKLPFTKYRLHHSIALGLKHCGYK